MARTIYVRCIYGIFGREITKYTVIYGVCIRFWPNLNMGIEEYYPATVLFSITVLPSFKESPQVSEN